VIAANINPLFDFFFEQYAAYSLQGIVLEITAVFLGLASVWYAKQNKITVYPTGMISTAIFVYLLWKWLLLGDMLINAYYFIMSAYGWFYWLQKKGGQSLHPIAQINRTETFISIGLFLSSIIGVYQVYLYFDLWTSWTAYIDTFTTALFFVGMWLMARRKIEHWIFWIIGDVISVPLYFYKGLTITSLQYIIFTFIAIYGYRTWKQDLKLHLAA
jgi:nicotinamide mononucleotide transporter